MNHTSMQHSPATETAAFAAAPPPFRRTLTKKDLCLLFGLVSAQGKFYYARLRREYFTPAALDRIGIPAAVYDSLLGGRPFDYATSQAIIAHFELTAAELSVLT